MPNTALQHTDSFVTGHPENYSSNEAFNFKLYRAKAEARVCRSSCAVQAAAHTDMHSTSATGDSYKVKQIKVNTAVMDFAASLSC